VTEEAWRRKVRDLAAASTAPLQTLEIAHVINVGLVVSASTAPLQTLEIADDVPIGTLVRALAAGGLTISNVTGRGLRIVRAPTPETQEDER
jgi:hypothetical protein